MTNWDAVGAIGQWFGGMATAGGIGVALAIAGRDRRLRDSERRDDEARPARLVTVEFRMTTLPDRCSGILTTHLDVKVHNDGEATIRQVDVHGWWLRQHLGRWERFNQLPLAAQRDDVWSPSSQLVSAHDQAALHFHVGNPLSADNLATLQLAISFTDSNGRRWWLDLCGPPVRDDDGQPTYLPARALPLPFEDWSTVQPHPQVAVPAP